MLMAYGRRGNRRLTKLGKATALTLCLTIFFCYSFVSSYYKKETNDGKSNPSSPNKVKNAFPALQTKSIAKILTGNPNISSPPFDGMIYSLPAQSNVEKWTLSSLNQKSAQIHRFNFSSSAISCSFSASGEGAVGCNVGFQCEFLLAVDCSYGAKKPWLDSLTARIVGPSVHIADIVEQNPWGRPKNSTNRRLYSVIYTVWDVGKYSIYIQADCYSSQAALSEKLPFFSISVEVGPVPAEMVVLNPSLPLAPCHTETVGRWHTFVNRGKKSMGFLPYNCHNELVTGDNLVEHLLSNNLAEISFLGGRHQLAFFLQFQKFLTGKLTSLRKLTDGKNVKFQYRPSGNNKTLTLNFYWLENIFQTNKNACNFSEDGIHFPISHKSKMIIIEATYWIFKHCSNPQAAYTRYLPWLLENLVRWVDNNGLRAHLILRSSPPVPPGQSSCGTLQNSRLKWAHSYASKIVGHYRFSFFDFWSIEAPLYDQSCPTSKIGLFKEEIFYSCADLSPSHVFGPIGEASVYTMIQILYTFSAPSEW